MNRGGESFPSEILSAYKAKNEKGKVLIVNGFDRLSGPAVINTSTTAGFDLEQDPGVPYLYNISLCGPQTGFDRKQADKEGKGSLGDSGSELEGMKIIGNTFDYSCGLHLGAGKGEYDRPGLLQDFFFGYATDHHCLLSVGREYISQWFLCGK